MPRGNSTESRPTLNPGCPSREPNIGTQDGRLSSLILHRGYLQGLRYLQSELVSYKSQHPNKNRNGNVLTRMHR